MIVFTCYILLVCNKIHFLNNCIVFIFTRVVWSAEWFRNFAKYNSFSVTLYWAIQGLYSLSGRTSYRKISWSVEAARLDCIALKSDRHIALKFDRHLTVVAEVPVKFRSDWKYLNPNLHIPTECLLTTSILMAANSIGFLTTLNEFTVVQINRIFNALARPVIQHK